MTGWLECRKGKNGTSCWIRDVRDGQQVCKELPAGITLADAQMALEHYNIRRDLEKEGYGDQYDQVLRNDLAKRRKEQQ